jgi:hypothetical protein
VQPLRLASLWIALGIGLLAWVTALGLAPPSDLPLAALDDRVGHGVAFLALMLWFAGIAARRRWWLIGAALFLFGAGIELLQGAMALGRVPDAADAAANTAGILGGITAARAGLGDWMRRVEALVLSRPR